MSIAGEFLLDPGIIFLNHGSFGATPKPVLEAARRWQDEMEARPVEFLERRRHALLARARESLAGFLGASPDDLVFVTNATFGVNVVARSLSLGPGDEVLLTDHEYGAVSRTFQMLAKKQSFSIATAEVSVPAVSSERIADEIVSRISPATKLLVVSHVTSPTAMIFPGAEICRRARELGCLTLVDGAHAPGQLPLSLDGIGADFYTGNLHKWLCAPKGCAFLHARRSAQSLLSPLVISWGYDPDEPARPRFVDEQEWQGTRDISAFLAAPDAIEFRKRHDWDGIGARCRELARRSIGALSAVTRTEPLYSPDSGLFAQMAAIMLPSWVCGDTLKAALYDRHKIEIPVFRWREHTLIRASFQAYNDESHLDALVRALEKELPRARR